MEWTPTFVATLIFVFIIVTYQIGGAQVALIAALILLPVQRRPLRLPGFLLGFAMLVGWSFLSWSQTESAWQSTAWEAASALAKVWLMALVVVNAVRSPAQARFFVVFLLALIGFYPLRGALFNYFIYRATTQGRVGWNFIYSNPNDLAALLLVPLSLCLGIWATQRKKSLIWWCALTGIILIVFTVVLSQSRGGTVALLLLLGLAFLGHRRKLRVLVLLGAALGIALLFAPSGALDRLSTLEDATSTAKLGRVNDQGSAEQRYEIWKVAITLFRENPATGVGPGAYLWAHEKAALRPQFKPTARGPRDAHSTYLTMLAEVGVFGFIMFATVVASVFIRAEALRRRAKVTLPANAQRLYFLELGFFAFLVAGIFGTYGHLGIFYLYLSTIVVLTEALREELSGAATAIPFTPSPNVARIAAG